MKMISIGILIVMLLALAILFAIGWYYSEVLKKAAFSTELVPNEYNLIVRSIGNGTIELISANNDVDELSEKGHFKLEWEAGSGFTKAILQNDTSRVTRSYQGETIPKIGEHIRLETFFYSGTPKDALGIDFEEVDLQCELGLCPAWQIGNNRENWVIAIHGKGSNREEALRIIPALQKAQTSILVITYQNDPETNPSKNGYYGFGKEWPDLEIAVQYALEQGAKNIILYGFSMGGAISLSFMRESPYASSVVGLILDAPVISFESIVNHGIAERNVPQFIGKIGKWVATLRFRIPWQWLDYHKIATSLEIPILIFHGANDKLAPIQESEKLALENPTYVSLVKTDTVGHARMWNHNPAAYEKTVLEFLHALR